MIRNSPSKLVRLLLCVSLLAAPTTAQLTLTTLFASNNGQAGNMFDLQALSPIIVDGFDVNLDPGSWDLEVWTVTAGGSHQGLEQMPASWSLAARALGVVSNGVDVPTPLPITLNFEMAPGATQGFYVTCTNGAGINYTSTASPVGSLFTADANLRFLVGTGNIYPFGSDFSPRVWNGNIHYRRVIEVPGDFLTIQAAINAAVSGQSAVLVDPNVYVETVDFLGKAILLRSRGGAAATIIDGNLSGTVVSLTNNEGPDSILDGFTVRSGAGAPGQGGGLHCDSASPTVRGCVITASKGGDAPSAFNSAGGGGVHAVFASPSFTDCTISFNAGGDAILSTLAGGGGVHCRGNITLTRCTVADNTGGDCATGTAGAGGLFFGTLSGATLVDSEFRDNQGGSGARGGAGGVQSLGDSGAQVTACTIIGNVGGAGTSRPGGAGGYDCDNGGSIIRSTVIVGNTGGPSPIAGGGGGLTVEGDTGMSLINCTLSANTGGASGTSAGGILYYKLIQSGASATNVIVWGNTGAEIIEVSQGGPNAEDPTITFSDIEGGFVGAGNFDLDPLFQNPGGGDYHLQVASPCVDAGNSAVLFLPPVDIDGAPRIAGLVVDVGADEVGIPILPGSEEDFALEVFVNGSLSVQTTVGDSLDVHFFSPGGTFNGTPPVLIGQVYPNASPPVGLAAQGFPEIHFDPAAAIVIFDGNVSGPFGPILLPPGGFTLPFQVSTSPVGFTVRLQAFALSALAKNGIFAASGAVDTAFL